ncbi:MAG: tetratricopeptide repeat protein [Elusimicrobia bacterium]|nr:tetratricopeptide repeat protein [Elusimicrobiota bacterium]
MKFFIAAFVAAALPAQLWADAGLARRYYDEGLSFYKRGDLLSALSSFNKSIEQNSRFLPAYSSRALARYSLGDVGRLKDDLENALDIKPSEPADFISRGNARVLAGEAALAIQDFNEILGRNPDNAEAFLGRGRAYMAQGNLKGAINDWTDAIKLDPTLTLAYFDRAHANYKAGNHPKAIQDLSRALGANKKFPLPYALLGVIFAEKGDTRRSLAAYTKAIFLHPQYTYAYLGRASVYLQLGQNESALRDYDDAVRLSPRDYAPYYNRGEAQWRLGNKAAAIDDFKKALDAELDYPPAALAMGERFMKENLPKEAAAMYGRGVSASAAALPQQREPWLISCLLERSKAYTALHEHAKAIEDLNGVIRISSQSVPALTARGFLYYQIKHDEQAIADLDQAIALEARNPITRTARGRLLSSQGKYQAALEDFNAAVKNDPKSAEAYKHRGLLYALGFADLDHALSDLATSVSLRPEDGDAMYNLAFIQAKRREYWKAVDTFGKSMKLKVPAVKVYIHRAQAFAALGDLKAAFADLRAAADAEPKNGQVYTVSGRVRMKSHDPARALKDLAQADGLGQTSFDLYYNQGLANGMLGQYKKAARDLKRAVELNPKSAEALGAECRALRFLGEFKEAVQACSEAVTVDPKYGPGYVDRGLAEMELKALDKATNDLYHGLQNGARHAGAELARSIAHAAMGQWKESDAAFRSAMDLDPMARQPILDFKATLPTGNGREYYEHMHSLEPQMGKEESSPFVHLVRGNYLYNAGYFDKAILEYTKAMEIDGALSPAYEDRCAALLAQQSFEAAEQDCRRAVQLSPKDGRTHARLVTLLTLRKKNNEGVQAAVDAIKAAPKSAEVYIRAGNLRYFMKDVGRAQENYTMALSVDPNSSDAYNGIGLCLFAKGQYADSIESFSRAIALDDRNDRYFRNRAAAYVNRHDYANAASDYKNALAANTDPDLVAEYEKYVQNSLAQAGLSDPTAKTR